jgi:hypothetical protein
MSLFLDLHSGLIEVVATHVTEQGSCPHRLLPSPRAPTGFDGYLKHSQDT